MDGNTAAKNKIYQDRSKIFNDELAGLGQKHNLSVEIMTSIVRGRVPTKENYDDAHASMAIQDLQRQGLDVKDAMRVIWIVQNLVQLKA